MTIIVTNMVGVTNIGSNFVKNIFRGLSNILEGVANIGTNFVTKIFKGVTNISTNIFGGCD